MPSRRHDFLAWGLPKVQKSMDLASPEAEHARLLDCQRDLPPRLPAELVPGFGKLYDAEIVDVEGAADGTRSASKVATHVITAKGTDPDRTVYWVHGGGFVAPLDPFHVRYAIQFAKHLNARVVMPDYGLAPTFDWSDSHTAIADDVATWSERGRVLLVGDSAGGNIALAVAQTLRDRGAAQPEQLILYAPWVDLTTSTPETYDLNDYDPWLFLGKLLAYASWWAGGKDDPSGELPADASRYEVSPVWGDLDDLPQTLMFQGTRDILCPGTRLLVDRAAQSNWDLTYLEADGLLHVFPLLPGIPEARQAWKRTTAFLNS